MNKIRDNLYVGSINSTSEEQLREHGITAVLNIAYEVNDPPSDYTKMRQVKVGLGDAWDNNPYMKELAVSALKQMLYNKEVVLVHCMAGASRAIYVVCRVIADIEGKQVKDVYEEVRQLRPVALYGPLFAEL